MASSPDSRAGTMEDAVDGVVPSRVVEPATGEALAAALASATQARQATVLRGGGTKTDWGYPPSRLDLVVSTTRLNRLVAHRHADLTATIQAGVTLRNLNAALARHRQWLPLDTAFDDATIGGLVATNDSGPLRHRYGTPRDLLIGATLALADGRLATSGGHVVKNVAGYDLGRLVSGSHGSFGALTEATFKLLPLPLATETLVVSCRSEDEAGACVAAISASQFDPTALDVHTAYGPRGSAEGVRVLMRFASGPGAVDAQMSSAQAQWPGARTTGEREAALWQEQVRAPWTAPGAVMRLAWLPAVLPRLLGLLRDIARREQVSIVLAGRGGVGAGHVAIDGPVPAQARAIELLRAHGEAGHVAVLRGSAPLKAAVSVWGPPSDAAVPLRSLKQMFDSAGILNAGRGPV